MLSELKRLGEAPEWMTEDGYKTIQKDYLLKDETPRGAYVRIARSAAEFLGLDVEADYQKFFDYMWKGWLCPASPVFSNTGTDRGLPISCFGIQVPDSVDGIYDRLREQSLLTQHGGGVATGFSFVRHRGAPIKGGLNGYSKGIIPWIKGYEVGVVAMSQGSVRKGAGAANAHIRHGDIEEFVKMRRPNGDPNRFCRQINHCVVISDEFMQSVLAGNRKDQELWIEILKTRLETGEPYIMFEDTVNRDNPVGYQKHNKHVSMTNICTEITLATDELHSFICCLSSANLTKYDEWKDTDLIRTMVRFLNGILNEFIHKAKNKVGFERTVASAIKGRAIGIGVLGWHSLLQSKMIPFDSFDAMMLNSEIFKHIDDESDLESRALAQIFGEPEWCEGSGRYNSHLTAVAPTRSNSIIAGDVSFGIEPLVSNIYSDQTAQGVFIKKNKQLELVLDTLGYNTRDVWKSIHANEGSVQHLQFLSQREKEVFLTAYEINQMAIVKQAAQRQKFIDQSQSVNLFFRPDIDPKYFSKLHIEAWKLGVKTLYYCRSQSVARADTASREGQREIFAPDINECKACEA